MSFGNQNISFGFRIFALHANPIRKLNKQKIVRISIFTLEKELNISSIYSSIPPVTAGCLCIQNGIQMISFPPPLPEDIYIRNRRRFLFTSHSFNPHTLDGAFYVYRIRYSPNFRDLKYRRNNFIFLSANNEKKKFRPSIFST